jgi:hypothetical protein
MNGILILDPPPPPIQMVQCPQASMTDLCKLLSMSMATQVPTYTYPVVIFGPVPNADVDAPADPVDDDAALDIQVRLDITS